MNSEWAKECGRCHAQVTEADGSPVLGSVPAPGPARFPAARSEDLGDETEICGCEEAVALRSKLAGEEHAHLETREHYRALGNAHADLKARLKEARSWIECLAYDEPTPIEGARGWLKATPATVAAPCSGCARLTAEIAGYRGCDQKTYDKLTALEQAIDAAVVELERCKLPGVAVLALSALRAAQKAR